jgi:hypothetical protein
VRCFVSGTKRKIITSATTLSPLQFRKLAEFEVREVEAYA